ncbi:hypothetical protein [Microbacterium thalli]|uniref:hypothetical protein n=1 Tax=Microbacterium thalli TaxID=3027921 RepID=UPI0023661151|nr:hypothetical protein [Microbacterium thalli]MDD7929884.1 hypothetical protein [Microbacterium thalli]
MSTETIGERRLREAREAVAALDTSTPTTPSAASSAPLRLPRAGEQVHALVTGTTLATGGPYGGTVLTRGQTFTITDAMLELSKNRFGQYSGVALVHDPEAQIEKYGEVRFAPGPAPADLDPWTYGSAEWRVAREQARREAWALPTEDARRAALAEVQRRFGAAPDTATTLNKATDPSVRAAEEQQGRIRAAGVRQASTYAPQERGGYSEGRE